MTGKPSGTPSTTEGPAAQILAWYDRHRRDLPWRSAPGQPSDAYRVWLSEIMLQQTTVAVVKGYYAKFIALWPTVDALAEASTDDVMRAWAGLGYYSRARNLHAAARQVAAAGSVFPAEEEELRKLPGVGAYTAAAIAAIAFGKAAVVVDGNVERVMVRLHGVDKPIPTCRPLIRAHAAALTPSRRPGDYAQALMDLGATVCVPRRPACVICPLSDGCIARQTGMQNLWPAPFAKPERPTRKGSVFVVHHDGEVLVRTRPPKGLLGGMTEFPGSAWAENGDTDGLCSPVPAEYRRCPGEVEHGFTHFNLRLTVFVAVIEERSTPADCRWIDETELGSEALPTLMRKVFAKAQDTLAGEER